MSRYIQFTTKMKSNDTINYLDLTITRNKYNKHEFYIYHKPPHSSKHPFQHKLAAYNSMVQL